MIWNLAERLDMHRLRFGNLQTGPIFANSAGKPLALNSFVNRVILPTLNRCQRCRRFERDGSIPEWHGWHAARRGLGSNLYRLGVPDMVIQRILRHANVSTTATYYIKTATDDVRNAMAKLENSIEEAGETHEDTSHPLDIERGVQSNTIQ
ncbi:MAG TPA: tyrosine-type recombinase/integrase [Terriglobia bacterium]|nr:tyrosine-type recombinase/integrase [Terriglobia bacterium]